MSRWKTITTTSGISTTSDMLEQAGDVLFDEEVPQQHAGGGDERRPPGACSPATLSVPRTTRRQPVGCVASRSTSASASITAAGHALAPVEPAGRGRRVVQQVEREPLLVGLHQQAVDEGGGALVEDALAGGAGALLHERAEVPLDRRFDLARRAAGRRTGCGRAGRCRRTASAS